MSEATTLPVNELPLHRGGTSGLFRGRRPGGRLRACCDTAFRSMLLFIVVQTWVVQGYKVYGSCMEPNLCTGERVLGSKLGLAQGVHRGDVVVFYPPHR